MKNCEFPYAKLEQFSTDEKTFKATVGLSQNLEAVFDSDKFKSISIHTNDQQKIITGDSTVTPFFVQFNGHWVGDVWVVPLLSNKHYLSNLGVLFSVSFILGMLVRYFTTLWDSLGSGRGDSIYPLIHQLVDYIEDSYPRLVIDHLHAPYEL